MRLRNIPRADGVIKSHPMVVQDTQESRGNWKNIFGNDRPVYLEIGMGKGRFLMNMAKEHPLVNFVGIERYSSVLLRALEKYDTEEYKDLQNIRFLCMDATEIENVFNQGEIRKIYLNFSGSSSALCFMCCVNYSASPKITCLTGVSAYKSIMPMIPHTIISPAPTVTKNIANMPSEP